MASFKKTKNRIQASVRIRGVKIYKTFPDKKSAKYWALNKEREILKGKVYELDKYLTLKDLLIRYQNEFTQFKSRPKQERQQIQRLILKYSWLVNSRISELTVSDFIKFKAQRVSDMGNNSFTNGFRATNGDLILFGSVYKKAIEIWNLGIDSNPIRYVEKYPASPGRYRPIKKEEYRSLLNFVDKDFRILILLYRATGLRPCELHSLTPNDFDMQRKVIIVRKGKSNKSRLVDCNAYLMKKLTNQKKEIISISQNAFSKRLKRATKNLGINDLIPYDFRRNRIQKLIDKGYPIGYVALQAGHRSFEMVSRYYGTKLR